MVRDLYPSFEAYAVGTGIPVGLLQRAKRHGCHAVHSNQVEMGLFLRWWYGKGRELVADYERERAQQIRLQNTKLRMALRRRTFTDWARSLARRSPPRMISSPLRSTTAQSKEK
ncbi:MAG TPA: hypothetical protein PKM43_10750 [Verrucomicrobiota bacterium]|nr:hypothetical protein [Verrucomicrobiota bacterium]HRZ54451.1 hypothetical protein [Candidatus Paceibacterota bacterium]